MSDVRSYRDVRDGVSRRDRSLRDKTMSLSAAAELVTDGMSIGVGGSILSRTPMAMLWQLIKAGRKDLIISRSMMSTDGDWVVGSGLARQIVTSWCAQGIMWGLSKVARHAFENGLVDYQEWSHLAMGMRYRAGSMALPFLPMRTVMGSGIAAANSDQIRSCECPFTGEKLILVPALNPSVALIHVQRSDVFGNAQIDGLPFMDLELAMAADRVIITTEQIVSNEQIRRHPDRTKIPFLCVDAVVEVPYGSVPHECFGLYEPMMDHLDSYVGQVNASPVDGFEAFLEDFVRTPTDWTAFLEKIGLPEILAATGRGRSIHYD